MSPSVEEIIPTIVVLRRKKMNRSPWLYALVISPDLSLQSHPLLSDTGLHTAPQFPRVRGGSVSTDTPSKDQVPLWVWPSTKPSHFRLVCPVAHVSEQLSSLFPFVLTHRFIVQNPFPLTSIHSSSHIQVTRTAKFITTISHSQNTRG
jgi:hypothetical protein